MPKSQTPIRESSQLVRLAQHGSGGAACRTEFHNIQTVMARWIHLTPDMMKHRTVDGLRACATRMRAHANCSLSISDQVRQMLPGWQPTPLLVNPRSLQGPPPSPQRGFVRRGFDACSISVARHAPRLRGFLALLLGLASLRGQLAEHNMVTGSNPKGCVSVILGMCCNLLWEAGLHEQNRFQHKPWHLWAKPSFRHRGGLGGDGERRSCAIGIDRNLQWKIVLCEDTSGVTLRH